MKMLAAGAVAVMSLMGASDANAAVTIDITQAGSNIALSASGTFDATLASRFASGSSFSQAVNPSFAFAAFGTQGSVNNFQATGPASFGADDTLVTSANAGLSIGINGSFPAFLIASSYVNNTPIVSSALIANATLASAGLSTGVYNYMVGGNSVTVNIGQVAAAVPEAATWAMMMVGLGVVGGSLRRRRVSTAVSFA